MAINNRGEEEPQERIFHSWISRSIKLPDGNSTRKISADVITGNRTRSLAGL